MSESIDAADRKRRRRKITSEAIARDSTAYHIVVVHLGGATEAAEIAERSVHTVYGWLQRGRVPSGQQENLSDKAAAVGKPFPGDWFIKVPETAKAA